MRIAITTWHSGSNSGTFFQLYGLYRYLLERGHEVKVIDYKNQNEDFLNRGFMYYASQALPLIKNKLNKIKAARNEIIFQEPYLKDIKERDKRFLTFWNLLEYTNPIKTGNDFDKLNDDFDAFVVGSDQVWNATMLNRRYFLDFVHTDKLKVAYGPSVGVGNVLKHQRKMYKKYVSSFNYVAVREKLLCDILNEDIPDLNVKHLLDPSMLCPREEYLKMAKLPEGIKPNSYVLCYFTPNNEYDELLITEFARKRGLKVVVMTMFGYSWTMKSDYKICADPSEFLGLIANAAHVFTSSFHCTIFSILFHRDLFVLERKQKSKTADINQRYTEQLRTYNIEHRYIRSGETMTDENLKVIDYNKVESIFQQRLKASQQFLNNIF